MSNNHVSKTIARSSNCRVDQCSCGAVHITVGGTTMRVGESVARELRDLLGAAFHSIDGQARTLSAPTPSFHLVPSIGGGGDDDGDPDLH